MLMRTWPSPLGMMTMTGDDAGLTGLWFSGQRHMPDLCGCGDGDCPVFDLTVRWLEDYFSGHEPEHDVPLRPEGTDFQLSVWDQLMKIPYGRTVSYGSIAQSIGCASARAVGLAVGRNPISLIIPCHRVIGSDGRLTGYAGGLWRKEALLRLEGVLPQED